MKTSPSMNRWRRLLLTVAVALTAGLVLFGPRLWGPPRAGGQERRSASSEEISVRVAEVRATRESSGKGLEATGTLESTREVQLAFAVEGIVQGWWADEGDAVDEGAVLAKLDPIPFEAEVSRAKARVDYLEKSLARSRRLRDQDALTAEELDAQRAELAGAQTALRLANWRLERSSLRAPFAARVNRRATEIGQVVAPGAPAFHLLAVDRLEMDVALAAADLARVELQAPVEVRVRGREEVPVQGRVAHAPVRSDARSGSVPLRVRIDNGEGRFLPGMLAEARFTTTGAGGGTPELRVPLTALRVDDEGQSVWRVEERRAVRVPVEVGVIRGDEVVVRGVLRGGDRVVLHPPDRLRDGSPVRIVAEGSR